MAIRYVHTNIIAQDWRKLAQFYIDVFECRPQYPERDLSGEWLEQLTGIKDVKIRGIHLLLPGFDQGPTLEIFQYDPALAGGGTNINQQGLGHIAFHVDDVAETVRKLVEHGGEVLGKIISKDYGELGVLTAAYAKDPEGNFIEIQNWKNTKS